MTYTTITLTSSSGIGQIALNRPDKLNAFTDQMISELADALKKVDRDRTVRCVVITGNGRGFCAGQDLGEVRQRPDGFSVGDHLVHGYHPIIRRIVRMEKPVIAGLNGVAAGAGVGLSLACDLRIASAAASFVLAFSKVGLIPDSGTNWLLPRVIGQGRAYQLAITAERLSADQALEWGMVNEVAPANDFPDVLQSWAERLAAGPLKSFALTKRAMTRGWHQTLDDALDYEAYLQDTAGKTADHKEGVQAFLEKRPPNFRGS